jgi:hypothetical protein
MTSQQEIETALGASIDCMRLAEQMLRLHGSGPLADLLREQADKNVLLLLPWVRR